MKENIILKQGCSNPEVLLAESVPFHYLGLDISLSTLSYLVSLNEHLFSHNPDATRVFEC